MTTNAARMQIAARIHVLMVRELGQDIDIEQMVQDERYARDVLLVCAAFRDEAFTALARDFRAATASPPAPAAGHANRPTEWSRNTSGFGVSQPMPVLDPPREPTGDSCHTTDATPPADASLARRLLARWRAR